ncbi:MAG: hypothetical protein QM579_08095 [Desulfovibrio sp.]|uniref:hypothetical protein n=1 Tax=Desulfovibrio sp. TaxID=885 RepID=UPI0039E573F0
MNPRRDHYDAACFSVQDIHSINLLRQWRPGPFARYGTGMLKKTEWLKANPLNHPATADIRSNVQIFLFYLNMLSVLRTNISSFTHTPQSGKMHSRKNYQGFATASDCPLAVPRYPSS